MLTEPTYTEPIQTDRANTEQAQTEPNWKLLPGTILEGGYELEELLEADERRARFKVRVLGDRTIDAFASFFPVNGRAAHEQIETWDLLRRAPHPNVSKPLAAGARELDGSEVVYVVLKRADETLNGVLAERALSGDEAGEVLLHCSRALEYLSRQGLVHGAISPEQVLAVNDSIQLSAEGVRKADNEDQPELLNTGLLKAKYVAPEGTANGTQAAAVWCLGATVFETLTQQICGAGCREQASEAPLGWILERCLDPVAGTRCRPEEIPGLLKAGPPPTVSLPEAAPAIESVPVEVNGVAFEPARLSDEEPKQANDSDTVQMAAGAAANGAESSSAPSATAVPEVPPPTKSPITNLAQARTKAFQQAEFDALTAPQNLNGGAPNVSAPSARGTSLSSAGLAASAANSFGSRAPNPATNFGVDFENSAGGANAARPAPSASLPSGPAVQPTGRPELRRRQGQTAFEAEPQPVSSRLWMYVAACALVLLLMFWALRSRPAKSPNSPATGPTMAQTGVPPAHSAPVSTGATSSATVPGKAWPTRTLEPDKTAVVSSASKTKAVGTEASAPNAALWRVVVYTFNRQAEAAKKAGSVNAKHPRLQAQVFAPNGHSGPYLVTVGGRMSRDDAARFRLKAAASGLPRDSYIQNYRSDQ